MATKKTDEQELVETFPDVQKDIKPARDSVVKLITKLCDDVTTGKARDEYKTLYAISELMTSIK